MFRKPNHSDLLIHWTGKDIDEKYEPRWWDPDSPKNQTTKQNRGIIAPYTYRLKSILKYGLWLMQDDDVFEVKNIDDKTIKRPAFARTSFTELTVSNAQYHAINFGRLGIGFKRMFVFERFGGPAFYYRPDKCQAAFFNLPESLNPKEHLWTYFLKSMSEQRVPGKFVNYDQYEESEWRIVYSPNIKDILKESRKSHEGYFVEPVNYSPEFNNIITGSEKKPEYLLPVKSRWLAMIIYPSIAVKVAAEADDTLRSIIRSIKPDCPTMTSDQTSAWYETYSKPFEIDLSYCRNL